MSKRILCALVLGVLSMTAWAQSEAVPAAQPRAAAVQEDPPRTEAMASPQAADAASDAASDTAAAQVVVSGRRPGPGVWKVSKGNHVMWVFGLYSPLPRNMEWDAERVERLLAQSQVLLAPPGANANVGFFKGLSLLPQLPRLIGIQKNPNDATLRDVLPADVYAHWTVLKAKYIGDDEDVERLRPVFVAQRLQAAARDKSELSSSSTVRERIFKLAKANNVKVKATGVELKLDNMGKAITAFKETQLNDTACFARTLDSLEDDLGAMRQRANAWANGDIGEIEGLDFTTREDACDSAVLTSSAAAQVSPTFRSMRERMRESWLAAAEEAMAENMSTFALLEMKDVFDPKGYLAALKGKGYTVESPR